MRERGEKKLGYISYRESKLTRILKSSLSGSGRMVVICCINPDFVEETKSTLAFAKSIMKVTSCVRPNEHIKLSSKGAASGSDLVAAEALIESLKNENNKLKDETSCLQEKLLEREKIIKKLLNNLSCYCHPCSLSETEKQDQQDVVETSDDDPTLDFGGSGDPSSILGEVAGQKDAPFNGDNVREEDEKTTKQRRSTRLLNRLVSTAAVEAERPTEKPCKKRKPKRKPHKSKKKRYDPPCSHPGCTSFSQSTPRNEFRYIKNVVSRDANP